MSPLLFRRGSGWVGGWVGGLFMGGRGGWNELLWALYGWVGWLDGGEQGGDWNELSCELGGVGGLFIER